MRYWKVDAKCGHVKKNRFVIKTFYVKAEDGKEAAAIVRWKPRVKHHHSDAIRNVIEIDREEYLVGLKTQHDDPFFQVKSKQEQKVKCVGLDYETYYEEKPTIYKKKTTLASEIFELSGSEYLIKETIAFLQSRLESSKLSLEVREKYEKIIKNSIQSLLCLRAEIACKKADFKKSGQTKIIS